MFVSWINVFVATILAIAPISSTKEILVETPSKDNSDECDCYIVSGPQPGYFTYHRFFDFRNISDDGDNDYTEAPPLITEIQNTGGQNATSAFLNTTDFQGNWTIIDQPVDSTSPVPSVNSAQNIYISRNSTSNATSDTYLTIRASRLDTFMSVAELDSTQINLLHTSIRARMRVIPNGLSNASAPTASTEPQDDPSVGSNASHPVASGAVLGFFTFRNNDQESDIEILTQDPINQIHYSNQPDWDDDNNTAVPGASTQVSLPEDWVWTDWHTHRLDWFDGLSQFWVDDVLTLNKTKNVPTKPSGLILNLWGDGGTWSGNMSVGASVSVGIQWIEMVFNVSGSVEAPGKRGLEKRGGSCHVGCWVDEVQEVGFPVVAFETSLARKTTLSNVKMTLIFVAVSMVISYLVVS